MATVELRNEVVEGPKFQGLLCPEFLDEAESASICPLLTPSPSDANMLLTSPDRIADPESASTCPLLESSPPADIFRHPLDPLSGLAYEQRSIDSELPGYIGLNEARDSRSSSLPDALGRKRSILLESSSSSSSSALQENPSCVQLLNHHYQHLGAEKRDSHKPQENGATCLDLSGHKITSNDVFVHWNWPVIRTSCFWTMVSLTVACFCGVVGMVATVPKQCYPEHRWYQGGVFYEIFTASFQDSDHDGIGDIRGVASRTEYLRLMGVSAIRLNSIFPAEVYPESYQDITNLTAIDPHLGTFADFKNLLSALHSNNISLIIDLPIHPLVQTLGELKIPAGKVDGSIRKDNIADKITNAVHNHRSHRELNKTESSPSALIDETQSELQENQAMLAPYIDGGISGLMKATSEHLRTISRTVVEDALNFWFDLGVDGIYIKGLENYIYDPHFIRELKSWKKIKSSFGSLKMIMADYNVYEQAEEEQKEDILQTFDLLDVYLEVSNGTYYIADVIRGFLSSPSFKSNNYAWLHWNIGNVATPRLSSRVNNNLGAIVFESMLPGTVSIFYGDENRQLASRDPHGERSDMKHKYQLSPMVWVNERYGFTPESILPWIPYSNADHNPAVLVIRNLTEMRRQIPSIYMNKIWKDGEPLLNCGVRYVDDCLIVVERFYPRRNTFIVLYNNDVKHIVRDISNIYYGGEMVQDSDGNTGEYVTFKSIPVDEGCSLVIKLDK